MLCKSGLSVNYQQQTERERDTCVQCVVSSHNLLHGAKISVKFTSCTQHCNHLCRGMEIPYQLLECDFSSKAEMSELKEIPDS